MGGYFVNNLRNYNSARDQLAAQEQVEIAMRSLVETTLESQGISAIDLTLPPDLDITFTDGTQPSRYTLVGTDLQLSIDGDPAVTVATNIQSVAMRPYQDNGANPNSLVSSPVDSDFTDSSTCGLEITVTAAVNQRQVTLTNNIYFRNR